MNQMLDEVFVRVLHRKDIYRLLDRVIETGQPLDVKRGDRVLKIVVEKPASK